MLVEMRWNLDVHRALREPSKGRRYRPCSRPPAGCRRLRQVVQGLTVNVKCLRGNLEITCELVMAESVMLMRAAKVGRPQVSQLME